MQKEYTDIALKLKILSINGKRLTRSIFNQLQTEKAFDKDYNFIGKERIGYIKEKQHWTLIFSDENDQPRKCKIESYMLYSPGNINLIAKSENSKSELNRKKNISTYRNELKTMQIFL